MTELLWLNGKIMPLAQATVSVEDRGFQFADGVYEVMRVYGGVCFALKQHLERLERSAAELLLKLPLSRPQLMEQIERLIRQSGLAEGMIYLQLTRGVAPRNHLFPTCQPTLLFYGRQLPPMADPAQVPGVSLMSVPDFRWQKCWVKSIALLPNVLAKNQALAASADEAVFVDNHIVSECSASNLLVVRGDKLVTHPAGPRVLPGITRRLLLELAPQAGLKPEEMPITEAEAKAADEVFITSTTREIAWVRQWDGKAVKPGRCGPATLRLHQVLQHQIRQQTGA